MKNLFAFVALVLLSFSVASAQVAVSQIFDDESYASGSADTSSVKSIGTFDDLSIWYAAADSNNNSIVVDYRRQSSDAWVSYTAVDSTNSQVAAGSSKGVVIRRGATDNIPGASEYRVRVLGKTTNQGVTTPTFDLFVIRRILP